MSQHVKKACVKKAYANYAAAAIVIKRALRNGSSVDREPHPCPDCGGSIHHINYPKGRKVGTLAELAVPHVESM